MKDPMSKLCASTRLKPLMIYSQGLSSVQSQIRFLPSERILVGRRRKGAVDHQHQAEMQVCSELHSPEQCYSIRGDSTLTHMLYSIFLFWSLDCREEFCSFFAASGLCPFEEECRYLTAKNTAQRGS